MTRSAIPPEADLRLLNALADGELDAAAAGALEARIAGDAALRDAYAAITATREALARLPRPTVDRDFAARMQRLARDEPSTVRPIRRSMPAGERGWLALAASLLLAVFVSGSGGYWLGALEAGPDTAELVANAHRRSLLAASPVDIASSNRHTVKPWLDARIGLSPPAPDLASAGFPLVGGRVDVIAGRPVPTLVYRHNEHLITAVGEPTEKAVAPPQDSAEQGYNMVRWSGDGFTFYAVSDLEPAELDAFVASYRAATDPAGASKGR